MALSGDDSGTPLLDSWIVETGEDDVAAILEEERRKCDDGQYPGFTDSESLLAYWNRGRRQLA
jgi:hypothetical protein